MNEKNEKKTLLVVDDAPENIDLLNGLLKADYKVKAALNGERALKIVGKSCPDLILLDVLMPGMDGYEVCRQLKSDPSTAHVPIIFVTGNEIAPAEVDKLGAAGAIEKPIDPVVLKTLIIKHI